MVERVCRKCFSVERMMRRLDLEGFGEGWYEGGFCFWRFLCDLLCLLEMLWNGFRGTRDIFLLRFGFYGGIFRRSWGTAYFLVTDYMIKRENYTIGIR